MALLAGGESERPITLAAQCLIGRSAECNLYLDDRRISSLHASIQWRDGCWKLRDLGSRNGTFVNGRRLGNDSVVLASGDILAFGDESVSFRLIDDSPPMAMARRLDTGQIILIEDGMLTLPHGAAPEACVVDDKHGGWVLERGGEDRTVQDGEILTIQGLAYMLHLPTEPVETIVAGTPKPRVQDSEIVFRVSLDQERVEVVVKFGAETRLLTPRAHYYTFLTLARARLRDDGNTALAEAERGWLAVDELCRMLAEDVDRLNVDVYRIRRDFSELGLRDPTAIIERKRGQLRLSIRRIEVLQLS